MIPRALKFVRVLTRSDKRKTTAGSQDVSSMVVEPSAEAKLDFMMAAHNSLIRTFKILHSRGVQWPKMFRDVTNFISECIVCQKELTRMNSTGAKRT